MKDWCKEPEEEDETNENVGFSPPWSRKGRPDICNLSPIKCDQAHTHSVDVTKHLVDRDIVWSNPAHPGEVTECLEQITRYEIPDGGCQKDIEEESLAANTTSVTHAGVCLRMKRVE
jgi:hypothetical protein